MSKTDISIQMETDIDLTSKTFFKKLARSLFEKLPEQLHPNRFGGFGDNPKDDLCESCVNEAAEAWKEAKGGLSIARKKQSIQYSISFSHRKGINDRGRRFPWRCVMHFNSKAKWTDAKFFIKVLVKCLRPAFAFSSTLAEIDDQHRIVYKSQTGVIEKKVHLDLGGQLPGIYRLTYFGPWSMEKFCDKDILAFKYASKFFEGVLLDLTNVEDFNEAHQEIRRYLGCSKFFDRKLFDPKGLELSSEDIAVVESAIAHHKRLRGR